MLGAHRMVVMRTAAPPDGTILVVRAGVRGIEVRKLAEDAERSRNGIGIFGVSVQASLAGEGLAEVWDRSRILAKRTTVWWATAGNVRREGFPLLPTGTDERHYTIALAHAEEAYLASLADLFRREDR